MSIRTARVNEEIRKVLSERLVRGLRDPLPGFVTIAAVEVTTDFSHAKVWVSVIGTDAEKKEAVRLLQENRGALRSEVARNVRLRQTPELHFAFDEAGERAARVWQILEEEKKKSSPPPSSGKDATAPAAPPAPVPPPPSGAPRGRSRGAADAGGTSGPGRGSGAGRSRGPGGRRGRG